MMRPSMTPAVLSREAYVVLQSEDESEHRSLENDEFLGSLH